MRNRPLICDIPYPHDSDLAGCQRRDVPSVSTNLLEIFPFGFEDMGGWEDSITLHRKNWIRFFHTDPRRRRARQAFSRIFDSIDCLTFMCSRGLRAALALEPRGGHWDERPGLLVLGARGPDPRGSRTNRWNSEEEKTI